MFVSVAPRACGVALGVHGIAVARKNTIPTEPGWPSAELWGDGVRPAGEAHSEAGAPEMGDVRWSSPILEAEAPGMGEELSLIHI
eukprot:229291-Alexandrium_andersonii.AAC.1